MKKERLEYVDIGVCYFFYYFIGGWVALIVNEYTNPFVSHHFTFTTRLSYASITRDIYTCILVVLVRKNEVLRNKPKSVKVL